jgi:hypothetical protein
LFYAVGELKTGAEEKYPENWLFFVKSNEKMLSSDLEILMPLSSLLIFC